MPKVLDELGRDHSGAGFTFGGVMRMGAVVPGVNERVLKPQVSKQVMKKPGTGSRPVPSVITAYVNVERR